jgi:hypothetical protein
LITDFVAIEPRNGLKYFHHLSAFEVFASQGLQPAETTILD